MFVTKMAGSEDSSHKIIMNPSWNEIASAIQRLDADSCTLVVLSSGSEVPHLSIGGGNGRYIVYITYDNLVFHTLIDPSKPHSEVSLVVGGQEGNFPANHCVDLSTAIEASQDFVQKGKLASSLYWITE